MKSKVGILLVGFISIIMSCAQKQGGEKKPSLLSNFVSITANEDKGVKEVLKFYGGQCKYSIGRSESTEGSTIKYFELEMSQSSVIERSSKIAQLPASNVAYLFYRNLKEEKENYNEIRIVIKFADEYQKTFKYPTEQLKIVESRIPTVEKIIELIKEKKFNQIKPFLNSKSIVKYDKNELVTNMKAIDPNLGNVKQFLPYGFRMYKNKDGKRFLHISGVVIRDKQKHEFSVSFDIDAPKEEVFMIEFNR